MKSYRVLVRHDALLSVHPTMAVASNLKEKEEEDAESLYRRLRKGKAFSEDYPDDSVPSFRPIPEDKMRRPLTIQSSHPDKKLGALNIRSPDPELRPEPAMSIPPPSSKHVERERILDNGGHGKGQYLWRTLVSPPAKCESEKAR